MLSEEEHSYRRENGPFGEDGWYEGEPGYWYPGRPFITYINSIKGTETQQELRKLMRELINEEI